MTPSSVGTTEPLSVSLALRRSLHAEPVVDGFIHEGEALLRDAAARLAQRAGRWVVQLLAETPSDHRGAVLRLLGRSGLPRQGTVRRRVLQESLESSEVEVRDSAIYAAEAWGDAYLIDVLAAHQEPVAWLRAYRDAVLDALSGPRRMKALTSLAARLRVPLVHLTRHAVDLPRYASLAPLDIREPGRSMCLRMGSLRRPGCVWVGDEASADRPYAWPVVLVHEIAHALVGEDEARTVVLEDAIARTLAWPPDLVRTLYSYQNGGSGCEYLAARWRRRGWLESSGVLSETFFRDVRRMQEVAMLKKPFSLAGSVPQGFTEAKFWELFDQAAFATPVLAPSGPGVHGYGVVKEADSWVWAEGIPYALFTVRMDVVRVSSAWIKAELEQRKNDYKKANDVTRVPRSLVAEMREALTEEAAKRATPEPKMFTVLIRFDQEEPDAEGLVPVTLWFDKPPGTLDALFMRTLRNLGITPGYARGIGDAVDAPVEDLPDLNFERKVLEHLCHNVVFAGDVSYALGDEVRFTTPSGSVAIKGSSDEVFNLCLADDNHRLSFLTLNLTVGEHAIVLKFDYPTYTLRGVSLPAAAVPEWDEGPEHVVARIGLLERLTQDFRAEVRAKFAP